MPSERREGRGGAREGRRERAGARGEARGADGTQLGMCCESMWRICVGAPACAEGTHCEPRQSNPPPRLRPSSGSVRGVRSLHDRVQTGSSGKPSPHAPVGRSHRKRRRWLGLAQSNTCRLGGRRSWTAPARRCQGRRRSESSSGRRGWGGPVTRTSSPSSSHSRRRPTAAQAREGRAARRVRGGRRGRSGRRARVRREGRPIGAGEAH